MEIIDDDLVLQNGAEHLLKVQLIDSGNLVVTLIMQTPNGEKVPR